MDAPTLLTINLVGLLLVVSLSAWRVTNIMCYEDGPWHIAEKIRRKYKAGEFAPEEPDSTLMTQEEIIEYMQKGPEPVPFMGELLSCFCCASLWASAAMSGIMSPFIITIHDGDVIGKFCAIIGIAFAGSAIAIFIEEKK